MVVTNSDICDFLLEHLNPDNSGNVSMFLDGEFYTKKKGIIKYTNGDETVESLSDEGYTFREINKHFKNNKTKNTPRHSTEIPYISAKIKL